MLCAYIGGGESIYNVYFTFRKYRGLQNPIGTPFYWLWTMGRNIFVEWSYVIHVLSYYQGPGSISYVYFTFQIHIGLQNAKSKMATNCQRLNFLSGKIWLSCNHVQNLCAYFQNIGSISYSVFYILNVPQNSKCKIKDGHQLSLVHFRQGSICQMILCDTCF